MSKLTKISLLEAVNKIESEHTVSNFLLYFDPIIKLFTKYPEIQKLETYLSKKKLIELIFNNKDAIHTHLYQEENNIEINSDENSKSLVFCFYLSLLINDQPSIVNYIYNINYIRDIFSIMEKLENGLKQIIFSKIICILIDNYKGIEGYKEQEEKEEKELNEKMETCERNIKNICHLDLGLTFDYIKVNKIDKIYSKIIIFLIKNNIFEDYDYACKLIEDLELGSINFTKNMIKDLLTILEKGDEIFKDYEILDIDDLSNIKIINFYYILFKFILKSNIYIYQVPFLLKIKINILYINSINDISYIINNNEKLEFIFSFFFGEEYNNVLKIKSNTTDYINTTIFKEVHDKDNDKKNKLFQKLGKEIWVKLINYSIFTLNRENSNTYEYNEIMYKYNNEYIKIKYKELNIIKQNEEYNQQNYFDVFKKFLLFLEIIKNIFNKEFQNYEYVNLSIKIQFETTLLYSIDPNIQCNYIFPPLDKNKSYEDFNLLYKKSFEDFNLLYKKSYEGLNSLFQKHYQDFSSLIKEIHKILQKKILFNNTEQLLHEYDTSNKIPQVEEDMEIYNGL